LKADEGRNWMRRGRRGGGRGKSEDVKEQALSYQPPKRTQATLTVEEKGLGGDRKTGKTPHCRRVGKRGGSRG